MATRWSAAACQDWLDFCKHKAIAGRFERLSGSKRRNVAVDYRAKREKSSGGGYMIWKDVINRPKT